MAQTVLPRVQAMVVCDEIEESDRDTEAINLAGVRAVIVSPVFPHVWPQLCVFVQMNGHRCEVQCHVEVESLATDEKIAETEPMTFSFEDPTVVMPMQFRLYNCVFPAPGVYYVQLYCEQKLIGERPLLLREGE
jgi:hypothetical protein